MKRVLVAMLALGLMAVGCSKGTTSGTTTGGTTTGGTTTEGTTGSSCGPAPSALASLPDVADTFPGPSGLKVTDVSVAGPSTVVSGYVEADLDAAYEGTRGALTDAGLAVTSSEKEEDDAEVAFSGNDTTGQVKLTTECEGRTTVAITIRPA